MFYEVFLTADRNSPHSHPTFHDAADLTAKFAKEHKGSFIGFGEVDGTADPSTALIDITEEAAAGLEQQGFVERLPIGGAIYRGVFPYNGPQSTIDELNYSFGGTS